MRNFYEVDGKYKEVWKKVVKPFDICEVMKSTQNHVFYRVLKQYLESKMPNFLHTCPYTTVKI